MPMPSTITALRTYWQTFRGMRTLGRVMNSVLLGRKKWVYTYRIANFSLGGFDIMRRSPLSIQFGSSYKTRISIGLVLGEQIESR